MATDIQSSLLSALSISDERQKLEHYRHLLSSIISSSNSAHAKAFIDHMVNREVSQNISRQLLGSLAEELMYMHSDARQEVACYAFTMIPVCNTRQEQCQKPKKDRGTYACRSYHTVTTVGNKLVIFGGIRENDSLNDVIMYNISSGKWILPEVLGSPPAPRHGHSAVLLNEERILVFGGNGSMLHDTIWFLEVDTPFVRQQSQLLGRDVVAWSRGVLGSMPKPVVICGPSGVGKGTLISRLMKEFPSTFGFSVSHTTRKPRDKEKSGVHYHFTERSAMELAIQEGKFLESADVHGNLYGTSFAAVEAVAISGKRCILDIDVQGAQAVKRSGLDASFIFIAPPSLEQLESRLRGRGTETEEQIQKRLKNARIELEHGRNSLTFPHYLVNDDLEECYSELKSVLHLDGLTSDTTHNGGFNNQIYLKPRHGHTASVNGKCVYIFGGVQADDDDSNNSVMIDFSSLSGGAPGTTFGLRVATCERRYESSNGHVLTKQYKE